MIDYQNLAYDLCRCYVEDWKSFVDVGIEDRILGWIRSRDLERLASCPDHFEGAYSDLQITALTRQVAAFFKKNAAFAEKERCDNAAQQAFEHAENLCLATNIQLDMYVKDGIFDVEALARDYDADTIRDILRVPLEVERICGDFNEFISGLPERIRVTAGATATRPRRKASPYLKVRKRGIPATKLAQPYLAILSQYYGYGEPSFETVQYNRVQTVLKNWETSRTIAAEPDGNVCLQVAYDEWGKERLRLIAGVDLRSQLKNQRLARLGSIDNVNVTVDLEQASDTCAFNAVWATHPFEWATFLTDIRTPCGEGFGDFYWYTKFSSMGNGATFVVETTIFTALCLALGLSKDEFAVYGDDIIVPRAYLGRLSALLEFYGFSMNAKKTFTDGPFRESCGTDWFNGVNVTPFYLRTKSKMKIELCHVVNGMAGLSLVPGSKVEEYCAKLTAQENLPLVPFNESTISGVWITPEEAYSRGLIKSHFSKNRPRARKSRPNTLPNGRLKGSLVQSSEGWPMFEALVPKTKQSLVSDSRTYFLWHLDAARRKEGRPFRRPWHTLVLDYQNVDLVSDDAEVIIRSAVPNFTQKYVKKWVGWNVPATATPEHLYRWTESLIRIGC